MWTLELAGVSAWYSRTEVLHDVDLVVEKGTVTALLGANGAGKTTTLRAICQMIRTAGSVLFEGGELTGKSTEAIVKRGLAHVPDGRGTFSAMTVLENLQLGGFARGSKADLLVDVERAFDRFPILKERRNQQAGTLSGGEQQMLAVSRALMLRPKLLLLDEPSFGLAPKIVEEIYATLRSVVSDGQVSMLLVEQNARLALDIADRAYLLENGRVALSGNAADVANNPAVRAAYLGH